jgi:filamentous hemagglutinin family protein
VNRLSRYLLFSALVWPAASLADPAVDALPSAPDVTVGDVTFSLSDSAAPTLDIHQSTGRAVISWDQFDVGADATVNFNQPNAQASTLNKVNGVAPSQIFGQINAPGEVILQNAAGVYFGPNSRLDVGALTATSMHIDEAKYLDGAYAFHGNGTLGHIINEGEIRAAENGYVALLAPEVRNAGLVVAHMGSVVMASGEHIVLHFNSNSHLTSITATAAQVDTLIENRHAVRASGGTIILSASAMGSLVSGVINMTGTLDASHEAAGVATIGGRIHLVASDYLSVDNATTQANGAQGGDIKLSAAQQVSITNTAIEATGASQGGTILIGNDAQDGSLPFAQITTLDSATHLDASGDAAGGFIETSGQSLSMLASVDVGAGGTWLIDPFDLTIDLALAGSINSALGNNANVTLTTAQETNAIASTPDPTTATGTSGNGDIYVDAAITSAGDGDLTLIADNDIHLNAEISLSGTDSGVTLTAANMTHLGANITTTGDQVYNSDITLLSGVTLNSGGAAVTITGNIAAQTGVAAFLGNGDYLFNGTSYTAGASANTEHPIGVIYDSANDVYSWLARTSAADILLVAGGGGGGMDMGGGGGGGGVIAQSVALTPGWLDLSVGAGGAGAPAGCTSAAAGRCGHQWTVNAQSGGNSTLQTASGTLTAIGGGYGGTGPWNHQLQGRAASGGSGGGAAGYNAGTSGRNGAGTQGQGHAGASGTGHPRFWWRWRRRCTGSDGALSWCVCRRGRY